MGGGTPWRWDIRQKTDQSDAGESPLQENARLGQGRHVFDMGEA
jgi:hypothetical protein